MRVNHDDTILKKNFIRPCKPHNTITSTSTFRKLWIPNFKFSQGVRKISTSKLLLNERKKPIIEQKTLEGLIITKPE